jgi:hypothetical protein
VPTVLLSIKNLSTIRCVKNYVDHVKATSIVLVQTSQDRGTQKQSYADEINNYPKNLGSCEKIITIQEQSLQLKQDLADMSFEYNQYRDALNDPVRHNQLCNQQYTNSVSDIVTQVQLPTLQDIGNNVTDAISSIRSRMNTSTNTT